MDTTTATTPATNRSGPAPWLRPLLLLDAGVSGANGIVYLAAASYLSGLLGPATGVLAGLGGFLVLWAVVLAVVATREPIPATPVKEIAAANLVWVAGSVAAALGLLLTLTGIGTVWCLLQAVVVLGFAVGQLAALRR